MNKLIKGFTCGAMDVFHAGHVLMMEDCKRHCDYLIVGLHTNPQLDRSEKNRPVQSLVERYIQLKGSKYIDEIIPYETESDLVEILKGVDYDVRFVGSDWKDKPFTGYDIPGHLEKVTYNQRIHDYSSSGLRKRIASAEDQVTLDILNAVYIHADSLNLDTEHLPDDCQDSNSLRKSLQAAEKWLITKGKRI